jgi:predicted Zn-dependent peptidase
MARAAREPFAEADVAAARASVIASRERRRESLDGWALEAATDEAIGLGCRFGDEEISRLGKVQPEDVQRVARRMFVMPVICVVTSDPEAAEAIRRP